MKRKSVSSKLEWATEVTLRSSQKLLQDTNKPWHEARVPFILIDTKVLSGPELSAQVVQCIRKKQIATHTVSLLQGKKQTDGPSRSQLATAFKPKSRAHAFLVHTPVSLIEDEQVSKRLVHLAEQADLMLHGETFDSKLSEVETVATDLAGEGTRADRPMLYIKRGPCHTPAHGEFGDAAAFNVKLGPDPSETWWWGCSFQDMLNQGVSYETMMHHTQESDPQKTLRFWKSLGIPVHFCIQRQHMAVVSTPGQLCQHLVIHKGCGNHITVNVAWNRPFQTAHIARAVRFFRPIHTLVRQGQYRYNGTHVTQSLLPLQLLQQHSGQDFGVEPVESSKVSKCTQEMPWPPLRIPCAGDAYHCLDLTHTDGFCNSCWRREQGFQN